MILGVNFHEQKLVKVPTALPPPDSLPVSLQASNISRSESARNLLRPWTSDLVPHPRKVQHPPENENGLPTATNGHGPDGRAFIHDDRERRPQGGAGEHQEVTRHWHVPGQETRHGPAGARTEDEEPDCYGEEA